MKSVSTEGLFILGLAMLGIGAWVVSSLLSRRRRLRHWGRRLHRTEVVDAKDGPIKLVGRVRLLGDPLVAPLTGRRGACYEAVVFEAAEPDETTKKIIGEVRCTDFLLDDGTGVARVRAEGATLELLHDVHRHSESWRRPDEMMAAFLKRHGEKARGTFMTRSLTYSEGVLEEGDEVMVFGTGRWEADRNPRAAIGYRDRAARLVVSAPENGELFITDDADLIRNGPG